jgi:hypothetical protein
MDRRRYNEMMMGLVQTAQEKQCVLGEDAKDDIKKISDLIEDMQCFWNSDEKFSRFNWKLEIDKIMKEE